VGWIDHPKPAQTTHFTGEVLKLFYFILLAKAITGFISCCQFFPVDGVK